MEILQGSKLLRVSAHAVKHHSQIAEVFDSAAMLLNMLLTRYKSSSCFDTLVEEVLDSNLALEVEIAVKALQVCGFVRPWHIYFALKALALCKQGQGMKIRALLQPCVCSALTLVDPIACTARA